MRVGIACICGMLLFSAAAKVNAQASPRSSIQRDGTALAIAEQAISASGGIAVLHDLHRWQATGTIAYTSPSTQAPVTVTIMAVEQRKYREDIALPNGSESLIVSDGKAVRKGADGKQHDLRVQHPENFFDMLFPAYRLAKALTDNSTAVVDKGIQTIDGKELHEIATYAGGAHTHQDISTTESDFFVDPQSQQILIFRKFESQEFRHDADISQDFIYSNFQIVDGIAVPFTVDERLMGHPVSTFTAQAVQLNPEIVDSEFAQ